MGTQHYLNNPLIHGDRRSKLRRSEWTEQFRCDHLKPLIICRGPIRKEAMDVFSEMGIDGYGILLSEKDSIVYRGALAPELRVLTDPGRVHRVPDYSGATKEEREQRIADIISIAHTHGYNAIFAGYGFMAEDEQMVASMERAGLNFIGPCSRTVRQAGLKDEAKRTALKAGVSVTPGIDNGTTLTLLKKHPDQAALTALITENGLQLEGEAPADDLEALAEAVLTASYRMGIDLYTIDELSETLTEAVLKMSEQYPQNRVRLKAIGGGGGKPGFFKAASMRSKYGIGSVKTFRYVFEGEAGEAARREHYLGSDREDVWIKYGPTINGTESPVYDRNQYSYGHSGERRLRYARPNFQDLQGLAKMPKHSHHERFGTDVSIIDVISPIVAVGAPYAQDDRYNLKFDDHLGNVHFGFYEPTGRVDIYSATPTRFRDNVMPFGGGASAPAGGPLSSRTKPKLQYDAAGSVVASSGGGREAYFIAPNVSSSGLADDNALKTSRKTFGTGGINFTSSD